MIPDTQFGFREKLRKQVGTAILLIDLQNGI